MAQRRRCPDERVCLTQARPYFETRKEANMAKPPIVTGIEVHEFQFEVRNMMRSE